MLLDPEQYENVFLVLKAVYVLKPQTKVKHFLLQY